jgi:hypothetical protein
MIEFIKLFMFESLKYFKYFKYFDMIYENDGISKKKKLIN